MSKVWFITGCSKGFGRIIIEELLNTTDARVVATARQLESLDDLKDQFKERLLPLSLDVRNSDQINRGVKQALEKFSRIDVLVNNAGYGLGGTLEECSMESIRNIFETNVFGLIEMTKAALPIMRLQNEGHIFNISSIAGLVGRAGIGLYNSTKFAVEGLSEALAGEVSQFGIHVTLIEPGPFRTDFLGASFEMAPEHPAYKENVSFQIRNHREGAHKAQKGDPVKAAKIIMQLATMKNPPLHMPLGNAAMDLIDQKITTLKTEVSQYESLARSADYD